MLGFLSGKKKSPIDRITNRDVELPKDKLVTDFLEDITTRLGRHTNCQWLLDKLQNRPYATHAVVAFKTVWLIHKLSLQRDLEPHVCASLRPLLMRMTSIWNVPETASIVPIFSGPSGEKDERLLYEVIIAYSSYVDMRTDCIASLEYMINGCWGLEQQNFQVAVKHEPNHVSVIMNRHTTRRSISSSTTLLEAQLKEHKHNGQIDIGMRGSSLSKADPLLKPKITPTVSTPMSELRDVVVQRLQRNYNNDVVKDGGGVDIKEQTSDHLVIDHEINSFQESKSDLQRSRQNSSSPVSSSSGSSLVQPSTPQIIESSEGSIVSQQSQLSKSPNISRQTTPLRYQNHQHNTSFLPSDTNMENDHRLTRSTNLDNSRIETTGDTTTLMVHRNTKQQEDNLGTSNTSAQNPIGTTTATTIPRCYQAVMPNDIILAGFSPKHVRDMCRHHNSSQKSDQEQRSSLLATTLSVDHDKTTLSQSNKTTFLEQTYSNRSPKMTTTLQPTDNHSTELKKTVPEQVIYPNDPLNNQSSSDRTPTRDAIVDVEHSYNECIPSISHYHDDRGRGISLSSASQPYLKQSITIPAQDGRQYHQSLQERGNGSLQQYSYRQIQYTAEHHQQRQLPWSIAQSRGGEQRPSQSPSMLLSPGVVTTHNNWFFAPGVTTAARVKHMECSPASDRRSPTTKTQYDLSELEMNLKDITIERLIGTGAHSDVYKARWRGSVVAMKCFRSRSSNYTSGLREFYRELGLMLRLRHPHLVLLMGASTKKRETLCVITEYCAGGNLFDLLHGTPRKAKRLLTWSQKFKLCVDIAKAGFFLHTASPPIIHRDLKSLNILLANRITSDADIPIAKVSDFGLSRIKHNSGREYFTVMAGTYHWMAPEVVLHQTYTEKVDVYSYGIVMYEIVTQTIPYTVSSVPISFQSPSCLSPDNASPLGIALAVTKGLRPDVSLIPIDCPKILRTVMETCWNPRPELRPSFVTILKTLTQ